MAKTQTIDTAALAAADAEVSARRAELDAAAEAWAQVRHILPSDFSTVAVMPGANLPQEQAAAAGYASIPEKRQALDAAEAAFAAAVARREALKG